jgi:tetratricopeptide (TPR) repeat protein
MRFRFFSATVVFALLTNAHISRANCTNVSFSNGKSGSVHEINIDECTKAVENDPNNTDNYYFRGESYFKLGEYSKAIQDFDASIAIKPYEYVGFLLRAKVYEKIGEHDKALQDSSKGMELGPHLAEGYVFKAKHGREMNDNEKCDSSLRHIKKDIAETPKEAQPYIDLAKYYAGSCGKGKEGKKVIQYFKKATEIDSKTSIPAYELAEYYEEDVHDPKTAIVYYNKALQVGVYKCEYSTRKLDNDYIKGRIKRIKSKNYVVYRDFREHFEKYMASWQAQTTSNTDGTINFLYKDLYATYGNENDFLSLVGVKLPKYVSGKIATISKKKTADASFFRWYYKDVICSGGDDKPTWSTGVLAYFDNLINNNMYDSIDNIVKEYQKISNNL